jgi:zinc transporter 7
MVTSTAVLAALVSTGLISLAPNLILLLFPRYASGSNSGDLFLSLGQMLAAGSLLGDVFLHTIPHAQQDQQGLYILLGFFIFLVADICIRSLSGNTHTHSHNTQNTNGKEQQKDEHNHTHSQDHKTSTILLNLTADALHNFTDGLAIGASFAIGGDHHNGEASFLSLLGSRGGLATLSILLHEIPHELGDFAILVKNGFSKRQAIQAQFGTAVAAMIGTVVGLFAVHATTTTSNATDQFNSESLLLITAGGFVYLACVTILPEVLQEQGTSAKFRLAQVVCFGVGVAFLYAVSLLEEMDGGHSHGGHSHGHGGHHHVEMEMHASHDHHHESHHDHHQDHEL